MTIEILGTGCANCRKLAEVAELAAKELGLEYELVKVTDLKQIARYGVLMTPALVADGEVKLVGKVPSVAEAKALLAP